MEKELIEKYFDDTTNEQVFSLPSKYEITHTEETKIGDQKIRKIWIKRVEKTIS